MIEIKKIPLSKLYKKEVPLLFKGVVGALRKHNPQALRFTELYDLLVLQMEKAEVLGKSYGVHPLTNELNRLHKKRLKYAAFINLQLRSIEKLDSEETKRMAKQARLLSKDFLTYLGQKRLRVVTFQIDAFFSQLELENNTESREAFIGLGLQRYLDELQKTNQLHYQLFNQRMNDIEERPQTRDRLLEKETLNMMRLFFAQVNSYQRTFKDIDYHPLICDINGRLTVYSKLLKTRVATNKRRAKKKKALAEKEAAANKMKAQKLTEAKSEIKSATNSVAIPEKSVEAKPINGGYVATKTNKTAKSMKKGKRKRTRLKI